jgi:hypothetical protein
VFQKYSILINYLYEDKKFPRIEINHLFPAVYQTFDYSINENNKTKADFKNTPSPNRQQFFLGNLIEQSEKSHTATINLTKDESANKVCFS